jgi:regulatory protein
MWNKSPSRFQTTGAAAKKPRGPKLYADEQSLYDYAVAALSKRTRTTVEMKRLLRRHVEPGETGSALIDAVVARLSSHGYLSDERFAASYSMLRREGPRFGRRRIAQDLLQKGVAKDVVSREVDAAFAEVDEETQARAFLARKRVQKPAEKRATGRVVRMLCRAGFSIAIAMRILRSWQIDTDDLADAAD